MTDNPAQAPTYCSIETVARELDCSTSTVREYVSLGKLPKPVKIGALVRWKWVDIDRWIQSGPSIRKIDPILEAANGA